MEDITQRNLKYQREKQQQKNKTINLENEDIKSLISQFPLFQCYQADFSDSSSYLDSILEHLEIKNYNQGEIITKQGNFTDDTNFLYLIIDGKVSIFEEKSPKTLKNHQKLHLELSRLQKVHNLLDRKTHDISSTKPFLEQIIQIKQELRFQDYDELAEISEGNLLIQDYFFSNFQQRMCYFQKKGELSQGMIVGESDIFSDRHSQTCIVTSKALICFRIKTSAFHKQPFMKMYQIFFVSKSLKKLLELNTFELYKIANQFVLQEFTDSVYQEGCQSKGIYILLHGKLSIIENKKQKKLIKEGELFGHLDLIDCRKNSVVVLNEEKVKGYFMSRELILKNQPLIESILKMTSKHQNLSIQPSLSNLITSNNINSPSKALSLPNNPVANQDSNRSSVSISKGIQQDGITSSKHLKSPSFLKVFQDQKQIGIILNQYRKLYSRMPSLFQRDQYLEQEFSKDRSRFSNSIDYKKGFRQTKKEQVSQTSLLSTLRNFYSNKKNESSSHLSTQNRENSIPKAQGSSGPSFGIIPELKNEEKKIVLKENRKKTLKGDSGHFFNLRKQINVKVKQKEIEEPSQKKQQQMDIIFPICITSVKGEQRSNAEKQGKSSQGFYNNNSCCTGETEMTKLQNEIDQIQGIEELTLCEQSPSLLRKSELMFYSRQDSNLQQQQSLRQFEAKKQKNKFIQEGKSVLSSKNQLISESDSLLSPINLSNKHKVQSNSIPSTASITMQHSNKNCKVNDSFMQAHYLKAQGNNPDIQKNKVTVTSFLKQEPMFSHCIQNKVDIKYNINDHHRRRGSQPKFVRKDSVELLIETDRSDKLYKVEENKILSMKQFMNGGNSSNRFQFDNEDPILNRKISQDNCSINKEKSTEIFFPVFDSHHSQMPNRQFSNRILKEKNETPSSKYSRQAQQHQNDEEIQNSSPELLSSSIKFQIMNKTSNCIKTIFPFSKLDNQDSISKISQGLLSPTNQSQDCSQNLSKFFPLSLRESSSPNLQQSQQYQLQDSSSQHPLKLKLSIASQNCQVSGDHSKKDSTAKEKLFLSIQEKIVQQNGKQTFQSVNQIKEQQKQITEAIQNIQLSPLKISDSMTSLKNGNESFLFANSTLFNVFSAYPAPNNNYQEE